MKKELNIIKILPLVVLLIIVIGVISLSSPKVENQPVINELKDTIATTSTSSVSINEIKDQQVQQTDLVDVISVVDGDTIKVSIDGKTTTLRLIGIDTPETVDPRTPVQCFGTESSRKAKELLSGKKVRIEQDLSQGELDKYGRLLAYVYRDDGLFYNEYMVKQGYAHEYTYNAPYKYQTEFKADQKYAQDNKLGLWSPNTCNGDTTQPASSESTVVNLPVTTTNTITPAPTAQPQTGTIYYTSSYGTSKYYYPESCDGWKSLSLKYLKSFNSVSALLSAYPSRTLSPQCQ
jgi:micrococcal nuclease